MHDADSSLPPTRSVRRDLQVSSATGAPPLGHLVGLHRQNHADGSEGYVLALDPDRPAMTGGAGIVEASMLADLALGGVIRNHVGLAVRMPTISMTIQLDSRWVGGVSSADAEMSGLLDRTASSRSRLITASGEVVGDAVGVFALPRLPYNGRGRAMPWDVVRDEPSASSDSRSQGADQSPGDAVGEAADDAVDEIVDGSVVDEVVAHAAGTPACAWGTAHVRRRLTFVGDEFRFAPSAAMANRLGHIQGGALFSAAVMAASDRGGFGPETFVSGTIAFLEPADLRAPVLVRVTVVKASGRSLFADARLVQGDRSCCHVSTVFRR